MMYLVLSIIFSTFIFLIFKYFGIYKINILQAIIVNYIVAFIFGMCSANAFGKINVVYEQPWFYGALILGFLFVSVFFVMALTSQKNGVAAASVAGKMSVIIPVIFGIIWYRESIGSFKVIGVLLALVAVYLSSVKEKEENATKAGLLLPILLFLGSGVIDTSLEYIKASYVSKTDVSFFSGTLFGIAGVLGLLIFLIKQFVGKEKIEVKNIIAGVTLGVPNYYSIIFLLKALEIKSIERSTLFIINNVGIVVLSTLVGFLLFKEQFSYKNIIGIGLAIVGIILVSIA